MQLIKSPMNYMGSKYKLLPQLAPLFPKDISTFVDMFAGGCSVGLNMLPYVDTVICNDSQAQLIDFYKHLKTRTPKFIISTIEYLITFHGLSDSDKEAYLKFRNTYNQTGKTQKEAWIQFYILLCHSFGNQIRFNSKGEFNVPFGKRTFNPVMKQNLINFVQKIHDEPVHFHAGDFKNFNYKLLDSNDYVYADPPYLLGKASYNYNGGWTEQHEKDLLSLLDNLSARGISFGLSNVMEHDGKTNTILLEWSKKYHVHELSHNYANSNYQKKNRNKLSTKEVFICNY